MIVKLKYISIGALVIILTLFYFINEKNKASAERIKQAEIERVQRLEQNKIDEKKAKNSLELQRAQIEKSRALKAEQDKMNSQKQAKEFEKKQENEKLAVIRNAENKVKDRLIDPDSATFRNQKGNCGEVNAKNKMGGYTGYSRYIHDPKKDHTFVESDASTSIITPQIMDLLWQGDCS